MNIFAKMRLKSMLRNCDYELAGTVLKQQYYDENKSTELNRLIDEFMANPGFEQALKLIEYNEMLVFYFTESCHGGLYVRKNKTDESGKEAAEDQPQSADGAFTADGHTVVFDRDTVRQQSQALHRENAGEDRQESPLAKRREQYEKLESAWNELLNDLQLKPKLGGDEKKDVPLFSEPSSMEVQAPERPSPAHPSSSVAGFSEARADLPDEDLRLDDPSEAAGLAEEPERAHTSPSALERFDEETAVSVVAPAEAEPEPAYAEADLAEREVAATASAASMEAPAEIWTETESEKPDQLAEPERPKPEPEVFYETMPFRNPFEEYERSLGFGAEPAEPYIDGERQTPTEADSLGAEPVAAEDDDGMDTIVPQHTRFPNVIGTLKIDIKEMKKEVAKYRRLIEEDPRQRETYEPWIEALEAAIEEFTLSVAILSQYR